jgi:IS605 OrfB family transposase
MGLKPRPYRTALQGSNNRHKARRKVAKVYAKITDARKDFLNKLTTQLVRENQTIVVEDLAIQNMVKNPKLALHISDAIWGELVRQRRIQVPMVWSRTDKNRPLVS